MQGSWVSQSRHDVDISCLQSIYMVAISAKYSFISLFCTSTKLGCEMYLNQSRSQLNWL